MLNWCVGYEYIASGNVNLFTVILLPKSNGKFPVVIMRTPYFDKYENEDESNIAVEYLNENKEWLKNGYEKFILLKNGNDMYNRAINILDKGNINPNVAFRVDQLNISYALVASGVGVCFATDTLFKYGKFRKNVFLYNVGEEQCNRTLYIAHKKNKYCTRAMAEFIKVAKEVIIHRADD